MKKTMRIIPILVLALFAAARLLWNAVMSVSASSRGGQATASKTTRYFYDKRGRLTMVITPDDSAAFYEYDPTGNPTRIRRAGAVEIISFDPTSGTVGREVTLTGVGFSAGVDEVSFNGTPAVEVTVTPPTLVARVPEGATTGPISVTTPRGTATTTEDFLVFVGS
jgi:YD repeat-containing protein